MEVKFSGGRTIAPEIEWSEIESYDESTPTSVFDDVALEFSKEFEKTFDHPEQYEFYYGWEEL